MIGVGSGNTVELATAIVSAYVSYNSLPVAEIPNFISMVHATLLRLESGPVVQVLAEPPKPAVPVKKSIADDYLICLEDGRKFKSLKRHLRIRYNMTPEQYRAKWGLPLDYPMVAPGYAETRSRMAKDMGLGQQRRRSRKG